MWLLVETCSLISAMRQRTNVEKVAYNDARNFVEGLTASELTELKELGCKFHYVLQVPGTALFVPCGWLAVERVQRGFVIYGVRKTVVTQSVAAHSS